MTIATTLDSYTLKGAARYRLLGMLPVVIRLALKPDLLADLKGAPLPVLLALAMHTGQKRTCFPSIDTLSKVTGYGRTTVIKALDTLEAMKLVGRKRRANTSTLYHLPDPPAPKRDPAPAPDTSRPGSQNGRLAREVQKIDSPHIKEESDRSEEKPPQAAAQLSLDEDWLAQVEALTEAGISGTRAEELVRQVQQRGHPPAFVEKRLAHYQAEHKAGRAQRGRLPGRLYCQGVGAAQTAPRQERRVRRVAALHRERVRRLSLRGERGGVEG